MKAQCTCLLASLLLLGGIEPNGWANNRHPNPLPGSPSGAVSSPTGAPSLDWGLEVQQGTAPNRFHLRLKGPPFTAYTVETSSNAAQWIPLATNLTSGDGQWGFSDTLDSNSTRRFYRVTGPSLSDGPATVPGNRILVKPVPGVDLTALHVVLGTEVLHSFPGIGNLQVIEVPAGQTAQPVIAAYQQSSSVAYVEPDASVQLLVAPNDPRYTDGTLWGLHNTGASDGIAGVDIHASSAWDIQHDAHDLIVAIIDTGTRYTHEDLAANLWTNPTSTNHGINVITGSDDPWDDQGHGTHLSGIIGAVGNNLRGGVGVAWSVQLMACKFIDAYGNGTLSDAITCIDFARTHGARIINASWGTTNFNSAALHDAIASARDAGIIFVAACGNSQVSNDGPTPIYPASYTDLDNIISVAATTRDDQLAVFSNYGGKTVHLGAPGQDIYSTYNADDNSYIAMSGTSTAAAMVSGACAVVWAHYPNESYRQVIKRVLDGADPVPALAGKSITGGRLDLLKALQISIPAPRPAPPPTAQIAAYPLSGPAPLIVQFTDRSTGTVIGWDWDFGDGTTHSAAQNPRHTYTSSGSFAVILTVTGSDGTTNAESGNIQVTSGTPATPPIADFAATPSSGDAPLAVQFTDKSTGMITTWDWNFGDGSPDSAAQDPSHTYTSAGNYTVTLTVACSDGTSGSKQGTVEVSSTSVSSDRPNATVVASDSSASAMGDPGTFTVQLSGSSQVPITVMYTLGGNARNGVDYQPLSGKVTIPAGALSADVVVQPIVNPAMTLDQPVYLMLYGYTAAPYCVMKPDAAAVTILGNH